MKSFAVIGLGLFGSLMARELFDAGYTVLAIDNHEENVERIADHVTRAVTLDAKNREALAQLGISKYDCALVSITGDLATEVLITMNLKALKVPEIICKIQSESDREVMEALGASSCIIPEQIASVKLVKLLTNRNVLDYTQLSDDHSIMEIKTPSAWVGKSVIALNVRAQYGINIIGIRRNGKVTVDFDPNAPLLESEELIIIGNNKKLDKIQKVL